MNSMIPSFEQMMMGEESAPEVTSCEASIDGVPCECNVCPDGEMAEMTCESIGVMSTCTDMTGRILGGLTGGGGEEVKSEYNEGGLTTAQVSWSIPLFQAIPSEGSSIQTALSLFVSGIVTILALVA